MVQASMQQPPRCITMRYWVMATDVSNAFNAMDTIGIVDGLPEVAPAVVNYFIQTHVHSRPRGIFLLLDTTDVGIVTSATGSQQGCPFGGLYFSAAQATALCASGDDNSSSKPWGAKASSYFHDDGLQMFSSIPTELEVQVLEDTYSTLGCSLSRPKSYLMPPAGLRVTQIEEDFITTTLKCKLAAGGMVVTGTPVGTTQFIETHLRGILQT